MWMPSVKRKGARPTQLLRFVKKRFFDGGVLMSVAFVPELAHLWKEIPEKLLADALKRAEDDPKVLGRVLAEALHLALPKFDLDYLEHVVVGAMLTSLAVDQRPALPMLDPVNFNKSGALPYFLWGLLYDGWEPEPSTGTTVFVTGYADRHVPTDRVPSPPNNLRKRIYWSAVTPDVLPNYAEKIEGFFSALFAPANANQPLMARYLSSYFRDLYWDLHVGVRGDAVPDFANEIGQSFNIVLANATPTMQLVFDNFHQVRTLRPALNEWLAEQIGRLSKEADPSTLVHYWLRNSSMGADPNFRSIDIMFECFHDFVALSQWGNTIYNTMKLLNVTDGTPNIRAAFANAMQAMSEGAEQSPSSPNGAAPAFDPLDRFVMELFRFINPNSASISTFDDPPVTNSPFEQHRYVFTMHASASSYDLHWTDPEVFRPDRFLGVPLAATNDTTRSEQLGFARCPFAAESYSVQDRNDVHIDNSIFGTTYPVVAGEAAPVCDYAGYAPFGFGYRRCPGELLNMQVVRTFLQTVWTRQLQFVKLDIAVPVIQPVGPLATVKDIYGFEPISR
jgi:hypothetical protein